MFGRKAKSGASEADKKGDKKQKTGEGEDAAATSIQCAFRSKQARRKVLEMQRGVDMLATKEDLPEDPNSYEMGAFVTGNNQLNSANVSSKEKADSAQKEKDKKWQKAPSSYGDALRLTQDGAPSYADLAQLTKKRNELLGKMQESELSELIGSKGRTERKKEPPAAEAARDMRRTFLQFCRDRRGSGLRVWRLDIDKRGLNRVPYLDFKHATLQMGLTLDEIRLVWEAYRPPGSGTLSTPLEFWEFDPAEWANLNKLLELLWEQFHFDIDHIWSYFDSSDDGNVDLAEFEAGAKRIGFTGNAKHIFYGMDTAGTGRLWKEELHYLVILQPESHEHPEDSPMVRELKTWVAEKFKSTEVLCDKLGMRFGGESMTVHSLARKLHSLGFKGDALHTAMTMSRCNNFVGMQSFIEIMGGSHPTQEHWSSQTYAGRCMIKPYHNPEHLKKNSDDPLSDKPAWNDATFDPGLFNHALGPRERHVFSYPFIREVRGEMRARQKEAAKEQAKKDGENPSVSPSRIKTLRAKKTVGKSASNLSKMTSAEAPQTESPAAEPPVAPSDEPS